ncbi:hypothetical protein PInf_021511 [Phytophthora infestans]|nr:hypothetical protein PInf_021511 [Phytophthora infestans]
MDRLEVENAGNEVAVCPEGVRGAARYLLSGAGQVNDQLLGPGEDERGVARNPLSGMNLVDDLPLRDPRVAVDCESRHHGRGPGDAGEVTPSSLCEGQEPLGFQPSVLRDTVSSSRSDGAAAPSGGDGDVATPPSSGRARSRRERRRRRRASVTSSTSDDVSNVTSGDAPRDCCEQLYTLVNGVTGEVEGDISLDTLPAADALLELDEMSIAEFGEALKAGELAEVALLGPEGELNSSSVVDDAVAGRSQDPEDRMEHPVFANLPPAQQDALTKLMSLLGPEGVAHLASQGAEAVTARLESFSPYENALLEHVQEKMSAATAAASMTREESMRLRTAHGERKNLRGEGWNESPSLDP